MTERTDGGPAFPRIHPTPEGGTMYEPGMTLRDYFAAKSLAGLVAAEAQDILPIQDGEDSAAAYERDQRRRAEWAYAQADAMLKARALEGGKK